MTTAAMPKRDIPVVILCGGQGTRLREETERVPKPLADIDPRMLAYGARLAEVDLDAPLAFHREQGRIGTVTGVHPTSRYGEMRAEGKEVVEFNEKPTRPEGFVSGGFFVFQREFFRYL